MTRNIEDFYKERLEIYKLFESKCKNLITEILSNENIKYHSINSRVKEEKSLFNKLKRKLQENIEKNTMDDIDITDLLGIRIITEYEDIVDDIVTILKGEFLVDEKNSVDKRQKGEDKFGYSSFHLILELAENRYNLTEYKNFKGLKFEVQIRSLLQHAWAVVSHDLNYKNETSMPEDIQRKLNRQASILEEVDDNFISIRERTKDYIEKVTEEIKEKRYDAEINNLSLESYLANSTEVKNTLLSMMKVLNPNASNYYPSNFIHNSVEKLLKLDISTLEQLDRVVQESYSKLPDLFKKWMNIVNKKSMYSNLDGLPLDTFIFYLVVLKIIEKGNINEQVVEEFFEGLVPIDNKKSTVDNLIKLKNEMDIL